jgi:peptidoglycan hydrolase-like protein with peptidoglycan-binding domain
MITMFDSVDVSQMPAGASYAYAGYVNGRFRTYPDLQKKFPRNKLLSIAVTADADADCLDVETGDATVAQVGAWVIRQLARGVARPCLYASVSQMQAVAGAVHAAKAGTLNQVRLWSAHYTFNRHICGPSTCRQLSFSADGTQWTDRSHGKNLDESVLQDDFFSGTGGTALGTGVPASWEETMLSKLPTLKLGAKDTSMPWYVRRIQGLCLACLPGIKLAIDGTFGASTESAVKQIQASHKVAVDGVVGPDTWAVLVTGSA